MNQLQPRLVWSLERQARVLASIHAAEEERASRRRFAVLLLLAFSFCAAATYLGGTP